MLGIEHCDWFILPLLLPTPTMKFSLDRKRRSHKRNRYSAPDSNSLIFTRSYRSALLTTTPTATPSLVKTSFKKLTEIYMELLDSKLCHPTQKSFAFFKLSNRSEITHLNVRGLKIGILTDFISLFPYLASIMYHMIDKVN